MGVKTQHRYYVTCDVCGRFSRRNPLKEDTKAAAEKDGWKEIDGRLLCEFCYEMRGKTIETQLEMVAEIRESNCTREEVCAILDDLTETFFVCLY